MPVGPPLVFAQLPFLLPVREIVVKLATLLPRKGVIVSVYQVAQSEKYGQYDEYWNKCGHGLRLLLLQIYGFAVERASVRRDFLREQ